jgi:hypothetical protein
MTERESKPTSEPDKPPSTPETQPNATEDEDLSWLKVTKKRGSNSEGSAEDERRSK